MPAKTGMPQSIVKILFLVSLISVSSNIKFGAGEVDPTFNAGVTRVSAIGNVSANQPVGTRIKLA